MQKQKMAVWFCTMQRVFTELSNKPGFKKRYVYIPCEKGDTSMAKEKSMQWQGDAYKDLLNNLDKLHTTELGVVRIKRNLSLNVDEFILTVNAYSYTIITAHKEKK